MRFKTRKNKSISLYGLTCEVVKFDTLSAKLILFSCPDKNQFKNNFLNLFYELLKVALFLLHI